MIGTFRTILIRVIAVGLISSGLLMTGCKRSQPKESAPSLQTQPPAQVGNAEQSVQQEARLNIQEGLKYYRDGDYDKAIKKFTAAIEKYADNDVAYSDRAGAFIRQKKFNEARDDLKKAVELNPNSWGAHYNFAVLYSVQNQIDSSLHSLDRALELGFNDYDLLRNDPDLNNVRKHSGFKQILKKYKVFVSK